MVSYCLKGTETATRADFSMTAAELHRTLHAAGIRWSRAKTYRRWREIATDATCTHRTGGRTAAELPASVVLARLGYDPEVIAGAAAL